MKRLRPTPLALTIGALTEAAAAGADLLITGGKRVLGWQSAGRESGMLRIVSPREAWGVLTATTAGH
jgi:hypothetical protein